VFDDSNPSTKDQWQYPDTKKWDPERNTREFVGNMSLWKKAGLLAFTVGMQGGSPHCYGNKDWTVSAFNATGGIDPAWLKRLLMILVEADRLGMVPIVQYFYSAQYGKIQPEYTDEAVREMTSWLVRTGMKNVIIDAFNERCTDDEDAERVKFIQNVSEAEGHRLLVSTSCGGGGHPSDAVITASDFILLHGNGQSPKKMAALIATVRNNTAFAAAPKPIIFNEDDHGLFGANDTSNLQVCLDAGASWGFLCCCDGAVQGDYSTGYQCPPVDWRMGGNGGCLGGSKGAPLVRGSKAEWEAALQRITNTLPL
jgi:hypothetical protein